MRKQDAQIDRLKRLLNNHQKQTMQRVDALEKTEKARSKLNYFVGKIASHDPRIGNWNGMPVVRPIRASQKAAIF